MNEFLLESQDVNVNKYLKVYFQIIKKQKALLIVSQVLFKMILIDVFRSMILAPRKY
jgi:hypothetical protein